MLLRGSLARAATLSKSAVAPSRSSRMAGAQAPRMTAACQLQQQQKRHQTVAAAPAAAAATAPAHAISNPTLADIEKRWEDMPPQEQADLWMALRDRMKNDWNTLTFQEKKAAYWIAFGPHGPRKMDPPGQLWYIFKGVVLALAGSVAVFALLRHFARPPPRTMTREWQEMSNEYAKKQRSNPITGVSSEGYKGKGHIQSRSAKEQGIVLEPDE